MSSVNEDHIGNNADKDEDEGVPGGTTKDVYNMRIIHKSHPPRQPEMQFAE